MNLHQVLTGAVNPGDNCFSVGSVNNVPFTVSYCRFLKYSLPPSALYSMLMLLFYHLFPPIMLILNINFKGGKSNSLFKVIFKINRYKWFASFYTVEIHSKPVILTLRSAEHWLLHECCDRWCCLCKDALKTHKSVKHTPYFFFNCKNWKWDFLWKVIR